MRHEGEGRSGIRKLMVDAVVIVGSFAAIVVIGIVLWSFVADVLLRSPSSLGGAP